jgi:hypothetical protein
MNLIGWFWVLGNLVMAATVWFVFPDHKIIAIGDTIFFMLSASLPWLAEWGADVEWGRAEDEYGYTDSDGGDLPPNPPTPPDDLPPAAPRHRRSWRRLEDELNKERELVRR